MSIDALKRRAMRAALKVAESERAQELMQDQRVQAAVTQVFQASMRAREEMEGARRRVAHRFNLATEEDLREMKRSLDRLERRLAKLSEGEGGRPARGARRPRRGEAAPDEDDAT